MKRTIPWRSALDRLLTRCRPWQVGIWLDPPRTARAVQYWAARAVTPREAVQEQLVALAEREAPRG